MALFSFLLFLSGCLQSHRTIHLNKDGSGTIEEKVLLSASMGSMMGQQMSFYNPEKLKTKASKIGEGVQYISSKEITKNEMKGYIVEYSFTDISKIKLADDAAENLMNTDLKNDDSDFITFQFQKGKEAELKVIMPEKEKLSKEELAAEEVEYEEEPEVSEEEQQQAMEMAKQLYADMEISTRIIFDGEITETDAVHKTNKEVILEEIIFADLPQDEKMMELMNSTKEMDTAAIEKLMKDYPGIKIENKEEIMIKFK